MSPGPARLPPRFETKIEPCATTTPNGAPMVDLDASPGNVQISQVVQNLTAGQHYKVEFMTGSPDPASSEVQDCSRVGRSVLALLRCSSSLFSCCVR